ncbi:hypothetical protein A3460_05395 [Enterobacter roggenkampii]|uniref:hypothetical protein n=1 Tax=Enterobacter roggenkampii TaxID=1812935 RepID=UPI0007B3EABC|nr:hypothetical protein [Enterobacter roggenkampii]KZP80134.1 hypothetical protein A3460_05395 [Enterobacter roggenkampii]
MERELTEQEKILADITGCIVGAITAAEQLQGSKKQAVIAQGNEAMGILHKKGYSFSQEDVDYKNPDLPTYIVTNIETGVVLFRMKSVHAPAHRWYTYFTI